MVKNVHPSEPHKYTYMYTHTQMTSKNLSVKDGVYRKLLEAKRGSESFSDVLGRLLEGEHDLMAFAGVLSGDKEFERVKDDIKEVRRRTVLRS